MNYYIAYLGSGLIVWIFQKADSDLINWAAGLWERLDPYGDRISNFLMFCSAAVLQNSGDGAPFSQFLHVTNAGGLLGTSAAAVKPSFFGLLASKIVARGKRGQS